jgi:large subunit ribosomal protein L17
MKKRVKKKKLGRKASHRKSMMNNLFRSLVMHGSIETTTVKAKALKSFAESLLNKYSEKNINNLRKIKPILKDSEIVKAFFELGTKGVSSVRVIRTRFRDGDKAEMSRVEFVYAKSIKDKTKTES